MGAPVVHFEVIGEDGEKLQRFYRELFDWKVSADNPMSYGIVETGADEGINGGVGAGKESRGVTFYVQVEDLEGCLERAESLGGKTVMPPTEIPDMLTLAQFVDPEGNRIGLVRS